MYDNNLKCIATLKPLLPHITESLEGLKSAEEEGITIIPNNFILILFKFYSNQSSFYFPPLL